MLDEQVEEFAFRATVSGLQAQQLFPDGAFAVGTASPTVTGIPRLANSAEMMHPETAACRALAGKASAPPIAPAAQAFTISKNSLIVFQGLGVSRACSVRRLHSRRSAALGRCFRHDAMRKAHRCKGPSACPSTSTKLTSLRSMAGDPA